MWTFIVLLQAITISGGTLTVDGTGEELSVEKGTFIPAPFDRDLAKSIVEKNSEIEKLNIKIDGYKDKLDKFESYMTMREIEITDFHHERYKACQSEVLYLSGPWNKWGKTALIATISAAVASVITYFVVKEAYK